MTHHATRQSVNVMFYLGRYYTSAHHCNMLCNGAKLKKPPPKGWNGTYMMYHKIELHVSRNIVEIFDIVR
jgi:hypothetical protein